MQYDVSLVLGYGVLTTYTDLAVKKSTIWYALKKTCVELNHPLPPGLCRRGLRGSRRRCTSYDRALWDYVEMLTDQPLIKTARSCPTRDVSDVGPTTPTPQLHSSQIYDYSPPHF
ncbi:hypothetical protein Tco_1253606 [Tanacetum coccineum]